MFFHIALTDTPFITNLSFTKNITGSPIYLLLQLCLGSSTQTETTRQQRRIRIQSFNCVILLNNTQIHTCNYTLIINDARDFSFPWDQKSACILDTLQESTDVLTARSRKKKYERENHQIIGSLCNVCSNNIFKNTSASTNVNVQSRLTNSHIIRLLHAALKHKPGQMCYIGLSIVTVSLLPEKKPLYQVIVMLSGNSPQLEVCITLTQTVRPAYHICAMDL